MSLRSSTNPGKVIPVLQSGTNLLGTSFSKLHSRADKRSTLPPNSHRSSSSQTISSSHAPSAAPQLPEVATMTAFQVYSTPSSTNSPAANGTHLSPSQQNTRRTSGAHSNVDSSPVPNGGSQNVPSSPLSPASNGQWSSAVGHAATGKSGRVIEKLMAENDKLKRELKEQNTKVEEVQRNLQTVKPQMGAMQEEIDNLSHAKGVDRSLLARRDRQIKELKDELAEEKKNRQDAVSRLQQFQATFDEGMEQCELKNQRSKEEAKHATNHAEILQTSLNQQRVRTETKIAAMTKEMKTLRDAIAQDQQTIARLDVVSNQMRQEIERGRKVQSEMISQWDALQSEYRAHMQGLKHETDAENEKTRKLSMEMDKVVDQMKWVMNLKKNTKLGSSD